MTIELLYSRK